MPVDADHVRLAYAITVTDFTREYFGGNTGALVRKHGQYVDCLTLRGDSFAPYSLEDVCYVGRYSLEDWQRWHTGEIDDLEMITLNGYSGTCRDCLLWSHGELS